MYFRSTLDFGDEVHYELRSKDTEGLYITISALAYKLHDYDGLGELATDISVSANRVVEQAAWWAHLEPTHVRLDPSYKDIL